MSIEKLLNPRSIAIVGASDKVGPGFNVIEGTIESMEFVGEVYEAEIRINDERLLARIDPDVRAAPGERVEIRLDPAHCLLLSA